MAGGVELAGADQLRRALGRVDLAELGDVHRAVAGLIAARAAGMAPRRTGRLAAAVGGSTTKRSAVISAAVPYAGVIHWGWPARNIGADTFLVDAARGSEQQWTDLYRAGIQKLLDEAATTTGK